MKKSKKLSLNLNKEVINQLDKVDGNSIKGGKEAFLSLWGSNCNNSDPNAHNCCAPNSSAQQGCTNGCLSYCIPMGNCASN